MQPRHSIACALLIALASAPSALAQSMGRPPQQQLESPEVAESVLRAVEAPFLTPDERADKRIFHGLWTESDIADPARRARAALISGNYDDPSFRDPAADPEDRAEAAIFRGEMDLALSFLTQRPGVRAARLRAEAFEALGQFEDARAAITPVINELKSREFTSAPELVESVRALAIKARLDGQPGRDYKSMLDLLVKAQEQLDRFYWPAILAQAELLQEKDNGPEAVAAAKQVLSLNPSAAGAWKLLGLMNVGGFNFTGAELVAGKLNSLVRRFDPESTATSPHGDFILARAAMRQSDPLYAQELLLPTLDRFPANREAVALRATVEALLFEYELADEVLAELDELSPGTPLGYFEVGAALSEARQYSKASEYLNKAIERQPNWSAPHIELGLMEMQAGRDTAALTALRRAKELDPYNTRANNSLILVQEMARYISIETPHFIIRHAPGVDGVMAREMVGPLEEIYNIVTAGIDHHPSIKTTIEVFPDHEWFAVRIVGVTGIHTIAAATGPVIAMEAPKIGKKSQGPYDWVRVVRHEYTHTVTLSRTNNRIPHWFTEAAAVYLENSPRDYPTAQLLVGALTEQGGLSLFDMSEINISFVRPKKPADRAQAYAQGHWMYEYIVDRWGARAPLDLMDLYALGIKEDQAMQSVLKISQQEFLDGFREWARKDAATWGMLPERSIRELLLEATLADPAMRAAILKDLSTLAFNSGFITSSIAGERPVRIKLLEPTPFVLDGLAEKYPDHPDVLELRIQGQLLDVGGNPGPDMIPLLERYAAARPVDPMPHRHLARLYLNSETPEKAIPHLEYLDAREQKSAAYAIELARRYAEIDQWDLAYARANRSTQISPFEPVNREFAASAAIKSGNLAEAERHIEALTEIEPQQDIHRERLKRIRERRAAGG